MDLVIYVIFIIMSFILGVLVVRDRIFGIAGILVGFIGASALYADGTLTLYRICDPSTSPCTWTSFSITGDVAIWIEVSVIVIDFIMLWNENNKYKPTERYPEAESFGEY